MFSFFPSSAVFPPPPLSPPLSVLLKGRSVEDVRELAQANLKDRLIPVIYKQAADEIAKYDHKVLLSGSFRAIVEPVSDHLGFDALLCSELETETEAETETETETAKDTGGGGKVVFTGSKLGELAIKGAKLAGALRYCTVGPQLFAFN